MGKVDTCLMFVRTAQKISLRLWAAAAPEKDSWFVYLTKRNSESSVYIHLLNKHINGLFVAFDIICPFLEGSSKNLWIQLEYFFMFLTLFALDYRLNPVLRKACKADIPKFCHGILTKAKEDSELEGQVISCLKLRYADQVIGLGSPQRCVPGAASLPGSGSRRRPQLAPTAQDPFHTFPSQGPSKKLKLSYSLTCSPFVTCSASLQTVKTRSGLLFRSLL